MFGSAIGMIVFFLLGFSPVAYAAETNFPNRAVTITVPYPAGGVTDLAARALAESLEKHLKQPFIVSNKVGGATTVGGICRRFLQAGWVHARFFPPGRGHPGGVHLFSGSPLHEQGHQTDQQYRSGDPIRGGEGRRPLEHNEGVVEYAKKNPGHKGEHRWQADRSSHVPDHAEQGREDGSRGDSIPRGSPESGRGGGRPRDCRNPGLGDHEVPGGCQEAQTLGGHHK